MMYGSVRVQIMIVSIMSVEAMFRLIPLRRSVLFAAIDDVRQCACRFHVEILDLNEKKAEATKTVRFNLRDDRYCES